MLSRLQGVPLHTVELTVDDSLSSANEDLLAGCCISLRLLLRSFEPVRRLGRPQPDLGLDGSMLSRTLWCS